MLNGTRPFRGFIAIIAAMILSACSPSAVSTETTKPVTDAVKNENLPPVTFDMYINFSWWPNTKTEWGLDLTSKEISRITGVTFKVDKPANSDENITRLNLMLSTGDYPDLVMMADGVMSKRLIQKGMFIPLDGLISQYGADIGKNIGQDYLKEFCTEKDGKIYGLPNGIIFEGQPPDSGPGILLLKGLYERLGSPPLNTVDDLYNYLVKVRDCTLKTRDGSNYIPSIFDWPTQDLSGPFGVRFVSIDGGSYVYGTDKKLKQVLRVPEMREIFHFTSKLFREKLIDQEWLLQDQKTDTEKKNSGRYAVYFAVNAFGWMDEYSDTLKKESGDTYILMKYPLAPGVVKPEYNLVKRRPWSRVFITSKCKNAERVMQFFNWEATEKGQYISRIGPEGTVWTLGPGGKPEITPEFMKKLAEDKNAALNEIGYMRWNWIQNNGFLDNAVTALMTQEERIERKQRADIILKCSWYAPELEQLTIDPTSETGIANTRINSYFGKTDRKLYMAPDDITFDSLYNEALPEMEKLGLRKVEEDLNKQINESLNHGG